MVLNDRMILNSGSSQSIICLVRLKFFFSKFQLAASRMRLKIVYTSRRSNLVWHLRLILLFWPLNCDLSSLDSWELSHCLKIIFLRKLLVNDRTMRSWLTYWFKGSQWRSCEIKGLFLGPMMFNAIHPIVITLDHQELLNCKSLFNLCECTIVFNIMTHNII